MQNLLHGEPEARVIGHVENWDYNTSKKKKELFRKLENGNGMFYMYLIKEETNLNRYMMSLNKGFCYCLTNNWVFQ